MSQPTFRFKVRNILRRCVGLRPYEWIEITPQMVADRAMKLLTEQLRKSSDPEVMRVVAMTDKAAEMERLYNGVAVTVDEGFGPELHDGAEIAGLMEGDVFTIQGVRRHTDGSFTTRCRKGNETKLTAKLAAKSE